MPQYLYAKMCACKPSVYDHNRLARVTCLGSKRRRVTAWPCCCGEAARTKAVHTPRAADGCSPALCRSSRGTGSGSAAPFLADQTPLAAFQPASEGLLTDCFVQ